MLFSSIPFLYYFLPSVLILYFLVPQQLKNTVLLISSLVFYGWGEPKYLILMVASIIIGYVSGLLIEATNEKSKKKQDKTTASISGFENNLKTDDFNKWEENIAYFNPNKETEETNIKKMLFGYENDRTTVNNDPSKLSPQYKELEGMYKIKPQPNRTNCDSLELNKRNIANNADCLNTANINYNTVSNTKNTARAKREEANIFPRSYKRFFVIYEPVTFLRATNTFTA